MKIAILADIHANIVALEAVTDHLERWGPDIVIVAGDVVNRGPRPAECLRFVQAKQRGDGWLVIRGNHEDYVISHKTSPYSGIEAELFQNSRWTYEQLNLDVAALEAWPFSISWQTGDNELRVAHASMRGNRDGIYVETDDDTVRQQVGSPPPGVFVWATPTSRSCARWMTRWWSTWARPACHSMATRVRVTPASTGRMAGGAPG
ncbi:MAG TPA: metallophosphoesterase [Anaerolineales bacterium]|nr:metallophosphoesterase [Anaerolineales bacterium]